MKKLIFVSAISVQLIAQTLVGTGAVYNATGSTSTLVDSARACASGGGTLIAVMWGHSNGLSTPTITSTTTGTAITWNSISSAAQPYDMGAYYAACPSGQTVTSTANFNGSTSGQGVFHISQVSGLYVGSYSTLDVTTTFQSGLGGNVTPVSQQATTTWNNDFLMVFCDTFNGSGNSCNAATNWGVVTTESAFNSAVLRYTGAGVTAGSTSFTSGGGSYNQLAMIGVAFHVAGNQPPAAPVITTTTAPNGNVGLPYGLNPTSPGASSYQLVATTTAVPSTLTWSITSGSVPSGLTLSTTGYITGTPTTTGAFSFTATVKDIYNQATSQPYSGTINAQPGGLSYVALTGITAQQAILQYQAVDNNACSVEVSQSPTFSPVEYDVDGTKFTGSSIDSRGLPGAISNGLSRTMIIGRRIAMIGNDGVRYSRSLEADATEYYRIICGLGTALSTGSFHTQTIPFGLAYLEPTLTDANLPGVDASPTTPWDRTTKIIDPRTGFAAHRLNLYSDAGDGPATNTGTNISWSSSTWSNPNNIQTGTAATVSGSSGLLIGHATILNPQNVGMTTDLNPYGSDSGHYKTTVTWIRVTVTAAVNVGGSAPSNANATLNLCVAMTSQTACDASSKTFSQVLTTAYAPYTFGSNTPGDFLRATFTVGIPTWAQQATNQINVILWKATTSTDTIYVDNVSIQYATGAGISGTDGGGYILSTSQPITGPDGEAGYFVMPNGNLAALAYFVGGTTGRTYFEGSAASGFNAGNTCATSQSLVPYQANNPLNYFCLRADGTIWRAVITPANTGNPYAQWQTGTGGATPAVPGPNTGFTLPFCNGSNAPCATLTAINQASNSTDLVSLLTSYTQAPYPSPAFNPTQFPSSGIYIDSLDATTSVILMHIALGGRTSSSSFGYPAWNFVFDPNLVGTSPGCVGAVSSGSAGCIIAAMPVWTRIGCRWCGEKQNIPIAPSYENIFSYYGGLGYQVQTISADGSLTQLSATPSTHCTASGYTAMYCDQITVSSEPYCTGSAGYSCMNTGAAGEAGSLQVGDYISNSSGCGQSSACEAMKIISKTASATANAWILVVVRGWNANIYATGALPVLYTMCNMNQNVTINNGAGGYVFWDYTDYPSGVGTGAINAMPFITGTHVAQGNGQWISACAQFDARCGYGGFGWLSATSAAAGAFSSRISQSVAPSITNEFFTFNGSTNAGVAVVQIHLSASPTTNYGYDAHPYQGTYQSTPPTCNTVSGYLCKFSAASPPFGLSLPFQKVSPILANTVANPLLNISGTGSVIGTTSADNYKFCIVSVSGECYTGSVQNEVYVNMPTPTYNYNVTLTNTNSAANQTDIEIQDAGHYIESIVEVAMTPQCYSCGSRTLTKMTGRIKGTSTFNNATPLWNGQWLMFQSTLMGDGGGQNPFFIGRIPSHAADNINRTTWIPQTITVPKCPLSSGVSAAIRFGYAENGTVASGTLRASARAENTIANATTTTMTGDGANPFWYETSETWSPVSCSSGCTITMNLLPQRAAYYQIVYYNSGSIVYTTSVNVILTP